MNTLDVEHSRQRDRDKIMGTIHKTYLTFIFRVFCAIIFTLSMGLLLLPSYSGKTPIESRQVILVSMIPDTQACPTLAGTPKNLKVTHPPYSPKSNFRFCANRSSYLIYLRVVKGRLHSVFPVPKSNKVSPDISIFKTFKSLCPSS